MNRIDVTKEVQEAVCQIATERFREVIPLGDAPHIVLYCGVDTDVEVREAEGDDVILEGTKASIGLSQEAAQASVERIEILADRVEDFVKAGPHEGEVFTSYGVELSRIEGDVRLFNSQLKTAQGIRGKMYQRFYDFGGTSQSEYRRRRQEAKECKIEDVEGEVDIDVGRVLLEAAHLSGPVRIYNRYGNTRLYQSDLKPGNRFCLESCSGEVLLFLKEDLIHQVGLAVHTICGDVNYNALKELGELNTGNDAHVAVLSTIRSPRPGSVLDADFYVKTESGNVTIEKMK